MKGGRESGPDERWRNLVDLNGIARSPQRFAHLAEQSTGGPDVRS